MSILTQPQPVDEIVVCDDGSTDETLQIINRIKERALVEMRVFCNETTLGVCSNFQKAIVMNFIVYERWGIRKPG